MSPFVSTNNVVYPVPLNEHLCRLEKLEQVHRDVVVVVVVAVPPLCQNPGRKRYTLVFPPLGRLFQPSSTRYRLLYYRNFQINSPNGIHGSTLSRNPPIFVVPSARLIASAFRGLINLQYWLSNHRFSSSAIFTVYIPSFDW